MLYISIPYNFLETIEIVFEHLIENPCLWFIEKRHAQTKHFGLDFIFFISMCLFTRLSPNQMQRCVCEYMYLPSMAITIFVIVCCTILYYFFSKKKSETNALLLICVRVFVKLTRPVFFSQYICALLIPCEQQFLWNKLTQYYFNNKFMMKMIGHTSILHQHIVQSMMHLIT